MTEKTKFEQLTSVDCSAHIDKKEVGKEIIKEPIVGQALFCLIFQRTSFNPLANFVGPLSRLPARSLQNE